MSLPCPAEPCATCPYRKDHPSGVWRRDHYEALAELSDPESFVSFRCHQSNRAGEPILCRGWLTVEPDSLGVRLGVRLGHIDPDDIGQPVKADLWESSAAAAARGRGPGHAGVSAPGGVRARRPGRRRGAA